MNNRRPPSRTREFLAALAVTVLVNIAFVIWIVTMFGGGR